MNREQFYQELEKLNAQWEKLEPELEVTVRDPDLDVEGYVVVWNTGITRGGPLDGCGKGGTRVTPTVSLAEVRMLARIMALKNAAAGLPLGGAKSALRGDPDACGFERQYRRFVSLCKPFLYENGGIFGGFGFDIGARPIFPSWACDELGSTRSFTGKPVEMGGTDYDREGIAGLGVAIAAKALMEEQGEAVSGKTFAVQGIGAMGAAVVRYFSDIGGVLLAVSDPRIGGTYILKSTPSADLIESIAEQNFELTKELLEAHATCAPDLQQVLYQQVDVLFPSAVQEVITEENAHEIKAKMVVEGANNPCTPEARTKLDQRNVFIIPDFIANPGGIIAAFVELTSDLTAEENLKTRGNVVRAKELTQERIADNVRRMYQLIVDCAVEPTHAGRLLALNQVFQER